MGCSWTRNVSDGNDLLDHPGHLFASTMLLTLNFVMLFLI